MSLDHPCIQCGACCAFFRVSFYWEESSSADPEGVPAEMTEEVSEFLQCMKGTNQPHPRCIALQGVIGEKVDCAIYARRSSACRDFGLHCENGKLFMDSENLIRCNEARKVWNLPPLTRADLQDFMHFLPVRQAPVPHHYFRNRPHLRRLHH
jgi:uncharacterized protein